MSDATKTDWTSMPETDLYYVSGTKKKKRKKGTKNIYSPWSPSDSSASGNAPGSAASGGGPGGGGSTNPGGYDPTAKKGPSVGSNPAGYASAVNGAVEKPFPGSFATNYAGQGSNPEALGMVANNPMYIANTLASNKFGLPAGSNTANALAQYLNPQQKWMGILGAAPTANSDWINFGAALMDNSALKANGAQLSPSGMMQNVVNVLKSEFDAMKRGGTGSSDAFNPITELARMNPEDALTSFVSMVKGMLQGTMPDDILNAYANFIQRQGAAFAQEFVSSDMGQMEASGANFLSALMDQLGPSLGL